MIDSRIEVAKLAHELGVDPATLAWLGAVAPVDVRALRELVTEARFRRHEARFRRLAKLSGVAPVPIAARIAQHGLGPLLGARTAAVMEPALAGRLAARLDPEYLTELSVHLDPVRAEPIIRALPDSLVVDVGRRLLARSAYLALGRFLSVVATATALEVVADARGADLFEVALFTEDPTALAAVVAALPDDRLTEVLSAADGQERYADLAALLATSPAATRKRLLGLADRLDPALVARLGDRVTD